MSWTPHLEFFSLPTSHVKDTLEVELKLCMNCFIGPTDEASLLAGLLKTEPKSEGNVVVRKGTTDDVLCQADPVEEPPKEEPPSLPDASYTREEFEREFGEAQSVDDYDADPRRVANFDLVERNDVTVEEAAGTISSMDAFKSKSGLSFVVKVNINQVFILTLPK